MTEDDFPALCLMLQGPEVMYAYGMLSAMRKRIHGWINEPSSSYML